MGYYHYYVVSCNIFLLFLISVSVLIKGQLQLNSSSNVDCLNQRCGSVVNVSYPFSILDSNCPSFNGDANFTLNCTNDVLYLGNFSVLSILQDSLIVDLRDFKSTYINKSGTCNLNASIIDVLQNISFPYSGPYVSAADNQFGSFGCSLGFLLTQQSENTTDYDISGCLADCVAPILNESSAGCGGNRNCCISNFPAPAKVASYTIQTLPSDPSACSSFAVPFHPNYTNFQNDIYGFRALWALPDPHLLNQVKSSNPGSTSNIFNVAELPGNISTACSPGSSSQIIIVDEVPGYRCSCSPGYRGDGYALGKGCADIDECNTPGITNLCVENQAECRNTNGSYTCHCKSRWHVGDGMRNGSGCRLSPSLIKALTITGGVMGVMLLLFSIIGANILLDRRRKRQYFKQNGGFELQEYIAAGTGRQTTRFFTARELREATQNFSGHLKLGRGGFGTVYRGTLNDNRVVAVKKANKPGDAADKDQFLNEMAILTQINHRHIVRLHGCCLETADPLLVYELVSNGDLAENLASARPMGWAKRLQVATQVADALAYLHAAASPPILHRDVKTANILLDDNLDAKVADFGISRLIPEGDKCVSTVVQGTLGYLDPEYFQTLHLTDKSDVYSFGVVLVELITGLKAVDNREREVEFANLALLFIDTMRTDQKLLQLIDTRLYKDIASGDVDAAWRLHSSVHNTAELARRCLALEGAKRPSMSELAITLHNLSTAVESPPTHENEELTPLVSASSD